MMDAILVIANVVSFIAACVALYAFWKIGEADKQKRIVLNRILVRIDALETLSDVQKYLDKGQHFRAMDRVGMSGEMFDQMTLQEASEVFSVRLADLRRVAYGRA